MRRVALLVAVFALVGPAAVAAQPSCATYDAANRPAHSFNAGDKVIVRGTGFAGNSAVLVTFLQGVRTVQIAEMRTNDLGAFATDPAKSKLPASVERGSATIQVLQGSGSASCNIQMLSPDLSRSGGFGRGFYLTWGVLLTLCAIGLGFATVRRWQAERLAEEVDAIPWDQTGEMQTVVADDTPLEIVEVDPIDEKRIEEKQDEPAVHPRASEAVARLQREVRSWRTR